jgi:hypothetical protein
MVLRTEIVPVDASRSRAAEFWRRRGVRHCLDIRVFNLALLSPAVIATRPPLARFPTRASAVLSLANHLQPALSWAQPYVSKYLAVLFAFAMFYSHEILTSRKYGVATIWSVGSVPAR